MFEAGSLIYRIQAVGAKVFAQDLSEADRAAKSVTESTKQAGRSADGLDERYRALRPTVRDLRNEILGLSLSGQQAARDMGFAMAAIGTAVVATAALSVRAARDWETAWTGVRKTVDENTDVIGGSYAEIEQGLRDLTKELPATHDEIAAVAEAAGQLGVRAQDIVRFTKTMIDLGETTNLTADEAATSLAQLMNIMQTAPEDVGRLGAAVVALGNNGASTERDIVQMSQRIAGAGKIIGLTEGETLGLANALASVGIEAEAGGTSVSKIMIDISQAVSQKGAALLEWAKLAGLSADEFAVKWRTAPAEALALVVEGMGRLNASGGDVFATLDRLGQSDVRVTRALLSLANSGDLLRNSLDLGNQAWADNLALQAEAEKRYATAAAKIDMARNSIYDMAIELGQHLLPYVVKGAEGIAGFAEFIGGLPDPVQGAIAILGTLVGVVTLVGGVALLAVPRIVAFRTAVATLSAELPKTVAAARGVAAFLAGPWGIALALAGAGVSALTNYLDSLKASSSEVDASLRATGATAESIFATFNKGGLAEIFPGLRTELKDVQALLDEIDQKGFVAITGNNTGLLATQERLGDIGSALAGIAATDAPAAARAFKDIAAATDGSDKSLLGLLDTMPEYKSALIAAATAAGEYTENMSDAERNTVLLRYAQGEGEGQAESAADAYRREAQKVDQLEQDLSTLLKTLDEANGKNRDAISANIDYRDALAEVDEAIQNARAGVDGYALGLDQNTQAGRDNMQMLVDLSERAYEAAEAQLKVDGDTGKFQATLQASRDDLIQRAIDFGYNAERATALADSILRIPTATEARVIADVSAAQRTINEFLSQYGNVKLGVGVYANKVVPQADGGHVKFFASGGENRIAQFARAGDVRIWAEPETGGEFYIPAAPEKRKRSTEVLATAADMFGYDLVPQGGPGETGSGPSGPIKLSDDTIQRQARAIAAELAPRMRTRGRAGGDL